MKIGKNYLSDKRGAAAIEFAVVSVVMILVVVFIMCVGLILYLSQTLDHATAQASRQIMTGSAQASSLSSSAFRASLCGYLPKTMDCGNLTINLYVVPKSTAPKGYYNYVKPDLSGLNVPSFLDGSGQFTLGERGDYQYLQVIYPITFPPTVILWMLGRGDMFRGSPAYLAISTMAFRNEQF